MKKLIITAAVLILLTATSACYAGKDRKPQTESSAMASETFGTDHTANETVTTDSSGSTKNISAAGSPETKIQSQGATDKQSDVTTKTPSGNTKTSASTETKSTQTMPSDTTPFYSDNNGWSDFA